ncbi:hypothetical protein [Asticcacaulis sp.]|uniref:hypothetical protein n=1 Tax=Asticcacaulis sp. TaxID=1872648 RepID=UPI003F7BA188
MIERKIAPISGAMSQRIHHFEEQCLSAGVKPVQALVQANLHRSLWWKWRSGKVSPTLERFEAAERGLQEILAGRVMPTASQADAEETTRIDVPVSGQPAGEYQGGAV